MNATRISDSTVASLFLKVLLFLVVAGVVLGVEHVLLLWLYPGPTTALAVRQFEPSDSIVESLRLTEFAKNAGITIRCGVISLFGLALFGGHMRDTWCRFAQEGDQQ